MANLTPFYSELRDSVYLAGAGKEELKALPSLPDKPHLLAAFQSIEDFLVGNSPVIKSSMDVALGITTSQALFRKIFAGYLSWKVKNL